MLINHICDVDAFYRPYFQSTQMTKVFEYLFKTWLEVPQHKVALDDNMSFPWWAAEGTQHIAATESNSSSTTFGIAEFADISVHH